MLCPLLALHCCLLIIYMWLRCLHTCVSWLYVAYTVVIIDMLYICITRIWAVTSAWHVCISSSVLLCYEYLWCCYRCRTCIVYIYIPYYCIMLVVISRAYLCSDHLCCLLPVVSVVSEWYRYSYICYDTCYALLLLLLHCCVAIY